LSVVEEEHVPEVSVGISVNKRVKKEKVVHMLREQVAGVVVLKVYPSVHVVQAVVLYAALVTVRDTSCQ